MPDSPSTPLCRNCGEPLSGPFCSHCGQEDVADQPFGRMVREFLGDVFNLDSRIWRTLKLLLVRPGWLSTEHRLGRRERYLSATRLYLVSSIIFFTTVALAPVQLVYLSPSEQHQTAGATGSPTGNASLEARLDARLSQAAAQPERLNRLFIQILAWAMFVLIPVFALLLKGLYRPGGLLYVHHLVFALHFHAFGFLTQAVGYAATHLEWRAGAVPGDAVALAIPHAANAVYLYLATRRFYGFGRLRTLGKLAVLGWSYLLAVALVMIATLGVVLLLL